MPETPLWMLVAAAEQSKTMDVRDALLVNCDKPPRAISYVVMHRAVAEIDRLRTELDFAHDRANKLQASGDSTALHVFKVTRECCAKIVDDYIAEHEGASFVPDLKDIADTIRQSHGMASMLDREELAKALYSIAEYGSPKYVGNVPWAEMRNRVPDQMFTPEHVKNAYAQADFILRASNAAPPQPRGLEDPDVFERPAHAPPQEKDELTRRFDEQEERMRLQALIAPPHVEPSAAESNCPACGAISEDYCQFARCQWKPSAAESDRTKQFCERILDCHPAALATETRMLELARKILDERLFNPLTYSFDLAALVIETFGEKKW